MSTQFFSVSSTQFLRSFLSEHDLRKRPYDAIEVENVLDRSYICGMCNVSFPTYYMAYRHKREQGQLLPRRNPGRRQNLVLELDEDVDI